MKQKLSKYKGKC